MMMESKRLIADRTIRKLCAFFVFMILVGIGYYDLSFYGSRDLGNGYKYVYGGREDYHHISFRGKMIVSNLVVDVKQADGFIFGVQLPRCSNTHPQKIVLSDHPIYFIVRKDFGFVEYYSLEGDFNKRLYEIGMAKSVIDGFQGVENWILYIHKNHRQFIEKGLMNICRSQIEKEIEEKLTKENDFKDFLNHYSKSYFGGWN